MKQAVLLHGIGGNDTDYFWFADTKQFLESKGFDVWWPQLPNTNAQQLDTAAAFLEEHMPSLDGESVVIAHSSGCPLIMHLLDVSMLHVGTVVLVAGYYQSINEVSDRMLPAEGFDFDRIRCAADTIVLINSDNDPWGCDDSQARPVADALEAEFVLAKGQGHMGSLSFDQPYREFPLLKELLIERI